ncbi:alpha/beta hydrolase [Skermania piniformis]|uniref:Alpha/beta hydrolase n=1 Tax=Skermania pinensis TaxID=39122 RepID=A0ABX8S869_9ACTN|nr:alpha/beta hydrolase [Skermania piniformis]QXQ13476.1 alpha/beta hydrolase [Skermania piniformis]
MAPDSTSEPSSRVRSTLGRIERIVDLNYVGLALAGIFFAWSVTPSLVPRDWLFQGLISGINAALGYGLGCLLEWGWRSWVRPRLSVGSPPIWVSRGAKVAVVVVVAVVAVLMLVQSARWQREIAGLMGMTAGDTPSYLRTGLLSTLVAVALVAIFRSTRALVLRVGQMLTSRVRIPRPAAAVVGAALLLVVVVTLVNGVLVQAVFGVLNEAFSVRNNDTSPNASQPQQPERSGSPASLAPWDTLGSEGRWFVSRGMTAQQLTEATGRPAREPIRAYAGLESADSPEAQAELAVAELERTGAFDRKVLLVATTTGTGWVNSTTADALELMYDGDTAIVATQYSYLPSVLSFLSDRSKSTQAAKLLFDAVHERWAARPAGQRPLLICYGESLGSQGSEAAFADLSDLRTKADGVLWVGPPNSNRLWSRFVSRRDPGSPEVEPVYADGLVVRFAGDSADLGRPDSQWLQPRVAYLQHPSDPIVWWSPDLLFDEPDWLAEPRGSDVLPEMRWWPIVTFWQVAADLTNAQAVTGGHGHRYGTLVLDGLVAVAPPPDWTGGRSDQIRAVLDRRDAEEAQLK